MATELRDLEEDRHFLDCLCEKADAATHLWDIADAAINEIERLKGLLVFKDNGYWFTRLKLGAYPTEAAAWAAVRKAAMKLSAMPDNPSKDGLSCRCDHDGMH